MKHPTVKVWHSPNEIRGIYLKPTLFIQVDDLTYIVDFGHLQSFNSPRNAITLLPENALAGNKKDMEERLEKAIRAFIKYNRNSLMVLTIKNDKERENKK